MRRLIDANALKAKLKIDTNTATYSDYCNGYCDARQVDLDAIDAAPTIEPEVRNGRWLSYTGTHYTGKENEYGDPEYKEHIFFVCSNCRRKTVVRENFCPNCGADMREEGTDNA